MNAELLQFRTLAETVNMLRSKFAGGLLFGGKRDFYAALGYKKELGPEDYRARYERGDIASRIVEAFPNDTWGGIGELIEDEDPTKVTPFEDAWFTLDDRLKIWSVFRRADILAGLGQYAVILIGATGNLDQPLSEKLRPEDILFLQPYPQADMPIEEFDDDPSSERFGRPIYYKLKGQRTNLKGKQDRKVHYSRCIHVADSALDDEIYGQPRLMKAWNRLDDLDKLVGGGSEAFWLRAHQGYQFDLDKDSKLTPKAEEKLQEEVQDFLHGMSRALRTKGVTVNALGSDVADFKNNAESVLQLISAATTIPVRILVGSERGELASTQDRDNWQERVKNRRTEFAGPHVVRVLVDKFIKLGVMPEPEEYEIRWPIHELSDDERAALGVKYAEVNQKAGETVLTADEIRDRAFGMEPLEIDEEEELDVEVEDENVPVAARRRRYGTALDKRRSWWRLKRKKNVGRAAA
jgi:hypothetical protein